MELCRTALAFVICLFVPVQGQPCSCTGGCDNTKLVFPGSDGRIVDVAYGKPANMSSTHDNLHGGRSGPACLAVNGKTGTVYRTLNTSKPNCVHTAVGDTNASWEVDLGRNYTVTNITIYRRKRFQRRMSGIHVEVDSQTCYTFPLENVDYRTLNSLPEKIDVTCTPPLTGRVVRLQKRGQPLNFDYGAQLINICEVQVWGCRDGLYGADCREQCGQCEGSDTCSAVSGLCPHGCQSGWKGDNCKQALDLTTTTTVPPTSTTQAAIRHDVVCGSTSMSFSIPMPANFKQTATLSDPRCQAQTSSNNSLYGSTNLNDCGTTLKVTNDSIVFSNNIILPLDGSSNSSVIRVIPIMCRYDRMTDLTVSAYMPVVRQVLFTETGVGQLSFRIRQYRDSSFSGYVSDSAYPLRLKASEEVFVQLDLGGQQQPQGFGMDVVRCVASPSPSYMGVLGGMSKENLIDNNCPASTDVHLWNRTISASSNHSLFRFSFKAVTFPDPSDPQRSSTGLVYIHCRVRLCASSECGSGGQCPSPSALRRNKREAEGVEGEAGHQLSTGPLLVDGHSGEPNAFSPLVFVMGAIAACATLVAMVAVVAWRRSRHRGHHQRLQEVTADQQ